MEIREYLQKEKKGFYKIITENLTTERCKQLYDAINDWHESELKLLGIANISKCYNEKDMDNAYDKGYRDGENAAADSIAANPRRLT